MSGLSVTPRWGDPAGGRERSPAGRRSAGPAILTLPALAVLAACAQQSAAAVAPNAPGFLLGLWHGFIFPIAWVIGLFVPEAAVYAVPNNGGWYDFGYFLGIVVFGVGARKSTKIVYRDRVVRERTIDGSHRIIREDEE